MILFGTDFDTLGLIKADSCANWAQISPIPEDKALRGFAPLLRIHQTLDYTSKESQSNLKHVRKIMLWNIE